MESEPEEFPVWAVEFEYVGDADAASGFVTWALDEWEGHTDGPGTTGLQGASLYPANQMENLYRERDRLRDALLQIRNMLSPGTSHIAAACEGCANEMAEAHRLAWAALQGEEH